MKPGKKKRLEAAGWVVGDVKSFLGLSDEEVAFIELKLVLSEALKKRRLSRGLTQAELAKKLRRSQSMVSSAETGTVRVGERYAAAVLRACRLPADWKAGSGR